MTSHRGNENRINDNKTPRYVSNNINSMNGNTNHATNGFNDNNNEIDKLRAQINHEDQLRQAVEQSYNELLNTSRELEKRMNMIDDESNEWKTRYENQEEINRQLTKQISLLEIKLEETKNRSKNVKNKVSVENRNESTPEFIGNLQKTKESLISQLKDFSWRIEQENKAYHKANEERKDLHQEILDWRNQLNMIKERNEMNKMNAANQSFDTGQLTSRKVVVNGSQKKSEQSKSVMLRKSEMGFHSDALDNRYFEQTRAGAINNNNGNVTSRTAIPKINS